MWGVSQLRAVSCSWHPNLMRLPLWGWVAALVVAVLAGFTLGVRGQHTEMLVALVLMVVTAAAAYEAGRRGGRS